QEGDFAGDDDLVGDLTDFELDGDIELVVHVKTDRGRFGGFEAGLFDGDFVSADRKAVEEEKAGVGSVGFALEAGLEADDGDFSIGHSGAAGVGDGTGESAGDLLCRKSRCEGQSKQEGKTKENGFHSHKHPLYERTRQKSEPPANEPPN